MTSGDIPDIKKPELSPDLGLTISLISPLDGKAWLEMGQLRARTYVDERAFLTPDVLDESGAEYDEYDNSERSKHIVAFDDSGLVIGTLRVVCRGKDEGKLPSEELFGIDLPIDSTEISRFIVDSKVPRSKAAMVSMSLIRAATKASMGLGNSYAVIEQPLYHYLNDIVGIKLEIIHEAKIIPEYNSENILIKMDPYSVTSQIHDRDNGLSRRVSSLPEKLAPFFETNATQRGIGRVSMTMVGVPSPEQFDRNLGFISPIEHERLQESLVVIAGVGGDGGELAVTLAQMGVGKFRLADPEHFEVNNLNRQTGASFETLGKNKAEVIERIIKSINPYAEIEIFTDGITRDNVDSFVSGADLVIDETEFTLPELGVMLARSSRKYGLPVLMALNIGFGSYTTSFAPNGQTFEKYLGLDPKMSLDEIAKKEVHLSRWVPHIPSYSDMSMFDKVSKQEISAPTVSPGVKIAAADAAMQAIAHLLSDITPQRKKWIDFAPRGKSIDLIDGINKVRYPRLHFLQTVAVASMRTMLKKNPRVT